MKWIFGVDLAAILMKCFYSLGGGVYREKGDGYLEIPSTQ
jgi:hypothetical protein